MHIAIDARLPAYQSGGISQYVRHLIPALLELDDEHRYTVLKSHKERGTFVGARLAERAAERVVWTPCHHRLERWALGLEVTPLTADILHSPDFIPPAFGARHHVITVHDLNFLHFPDFVSAEARRYYTDQIRWAVERADHISADSHHTRRDLIDLLSVPANKITVVHLAANPLFHRPLDEALVQQVLARYRLERGYVLFVGTLSPRKNLQVLLEALVGLNDIRLVLAGKPGWRAEEIVAAIDKLDLQSRVTHVPAAADAELAALYRGASVLAFPSVYEGFGLPPLEAMASGCPVIASTAASVPEVVGEGGLLIEPTDISAWRDALARVLEDADLRAALIARGHEQAGQFSWARTAAATRKIYDTAAG